MIKLTSIDWEVYSYLKKKFKEDPTQWVSKNQLITDIPALKLSKATSHDVCSTLNSIRIKLNKASNEGQISHLILLHKSKFKIACNVEEAKKYLYKDYLTGIKRIIRYYENMKVLKRDGQYKLIDCKGNVIDDKSLAKRFEDVFNVS